MKNRIWYKKKQRSIAGFTLIELLVVIVIIAVLFAIAAPGWTALMNRQRVNVVREQATQLIRQAQSDARRTRVARLVIFQDGSDTNNSTGLPRAVVLPQPLGADEQTAAIPIPIPANLPWQSLGNGDVKSGVLVLTTTPTAAGGQVVFNSNGAIDNASVIKKDPNRNAFFTVTVAQKNPSSNTPLPKTNRCVAVTTLLGAIRNADGDDCTNL